MRIFVLVTKVLPMLLALCHFLNVILSYYCVDCAILNYIGCIGILTVAYLYLVSYVLRLCTYYRMFLHYCVVIDAISLFDYYVGVPINDYGMLTLYIGITIVMMIMIICVKYGSKRYD